MQLLKRLSNDFLHLIFPHNCIGCGTDILSDEQTLCLRCIHELPETNFFEYPNNPVEAAFYGRLSLRNAAAGYFFTKESLIQHLIFQLKYRGNKEVGVYLGELLGRLILKTNRFEQIDALIPLPLNPRRETKRGYNQATQICKGISNIINVPVIEDAVIRKVYTETQTHMGRINRWQNMDGVFSVTDSAQLANKHLLLVDDVVTTGATIEACGNAILQTPGSTLSVATVAYTI